MKKHITLILLFIITTSFAPQKQLTWTAIGDSITYMNGRPELSKDRISRGYMDDVVDKLPYVKYVNNGTPAGQRKASPTILIISTW
ncbi:hypothetical protein ACVW0P_000083 [Mucilaginibacter sp. UYNi724]